MSIPILLEKIKSSIEGEKGKDFLVVLTVVCVAIASFALGRMSNSSIKTQNPVTVKFDPSITDYFYKDTNVGQGNTPTLSPSGKITDDILSKDDAVLGATLNKDTSEELQATVDVRGGDIEKSDIVASSRGSKYYYTYCSGAKTLSEQNKVYFSSEEEAEANGYTLSTSCTKK